MKQECPLLTVHLKLRVTGTSHSVWRFSFRRIFVGRDIFIVAKESTVARTRNQYRVLKASDHLRWLMFVFGFGLIMVGLAVIYSVSHAIGVVLVPCLY